MSRVFSAGAAYHPSRDVRDHLVLADCAAKEPNGAFWPIIASRRSGKTWELKALEHQLRDNANVRYYDLRHKDDQKEFHSNGDAGIVLLDEPGECLFATNGAVPKKARDLLARCHVLKAKKIWVVIALSPSEWQRMAEADPTGALANSKDLHFLRPLDDKESAKFGQRADWAPAVIESLPRTWRRNPFLLELALQTGENDPKLRGSLPDLSELVRIALLQSRSVSCRYLKSLYNEGLSDVQRSTLREIAWQTPLPEQDDTRELLAGCGLIENQPDGWRLVDPVLLSHLPPPLRIHHVSDLHVGEKTAQVVDNKTRGNVGGRLADAAGEASVRDDYLKHVRSLGHSTPHLVVVSGDIAERGEDALYEEAKSWLATLEKQLQSHPHLADGEPRVLLVGGNHDVDWKETTGSAGARKRHLPFARAFNGRPRPRLEETPETRGLACVEYRHVNLAFFLLGSAEFGGEKEESPAWKLVHDAVEEMRLKTVAALDNKQFDDATKLLENIGRVDPGFVHKKDLERVRASRTRMAVKIAVLHHPVSPLPFTEVARFAGLLNAGETKDALFAAKCALVLHGHMHYGWFASERWPAEHKDWTLRIAAAPTLGSRETQQNLGFNEIVITYEGEECFVQVRRFARSGASWIEHAEKLGPFRPGDGADRIEQINGAAPTRRKKTLR